MPSNVLATKSDLRELEMRIHKYFGAILVAHAGTAALTVVLLQLLR